MTREEEILKELTTRPRKQQYEPRFTPANMHGYFQADLLFLPQDPTTKAQYCLTIIDVARNKLYATPLVVKEAKIVSEAFFKALGDDIRNVSVLAVDDGSEFKGVFATTINTYNSQAGEKKRKAATKSGVIHENTIRIKVAPPRRHRNQAFVEGANLYLGKFLFRKLQAIEIRTGKLALGWVKFLDEAVERYNEKHADQRPPHVNRDIDIDEQMANMILLGSRVRRLLDGPQEITGDRLDERFRATDIRWSPDIYVIHEIKIWPDSPIMYQIRLVEPFGNVKKRNMYDNTWFAQNQLLETKF